MKEHFLHKNWQVLLIACWCWTVPTMLVYASSPKEQPVEIVFLDGLSDVVTPQVFAAKDKYVVKVQAIPAANLDLVRISLTSSGMLKAEIAGDHSAQREFKNAKSGEKIVIPLELSLLANAGDTGTVQIVADTETPQSAVSQNLNGYVAGEKLYLGSLSIISLKQTFISDQEKSGLITAEESLRLRKALTTLHQP